MAKPQDLRGWNAVITGGAGGLGRATAARLIQRGVRCLLVDIDADALARAVQALGPLACAQVADLTDPAARDRLAERLDTDWGQLQLLVNNAGIVGTTPFEQRTPASIRGELELNLMAPLLLTHRLLPLLQRSGDGRVVNIVSLGGMFPLPESTVYSASKFGLRGAMLCLGLDGARLGIRVSIVNPSATDTPMLMREALNGGNKLQFMGAPSRRRSVRSLQLAWRASSGCRGACSASLRSRSAIDSTNSLRDGGRWIRVSSCCRNSPQVVRS